MWDSCNTLGVGSSWPHSTLKQFLHHLKHLDLSVPPVGIGVHLITLPGGWGWLCWDEMLNKVLGQVETKSHLAMCTQTQGAFLDRKL